MQVNQRLMMNFIVALSSIFLGILTTFMVWAFQWVLDSHEEVKLGMPGEITKLNVVEGSQIVALSDAMTAQRELKNYIHHKSLILIISSDGISFPEMIIYDPHGLLSWFPMAIDEDSHSRVSDLYLFDGTYSERRWSANAVTPLLPEGVTVKGIVPAPPCGVGNLQWARRLGQYPLAPGNYTIRINTIDPTQVRQILNLLFDMGLVLQQTRIIPLVGYLVLNPLFIITMFFLMMGHVCTVLYWSFYLRGRAHEFYIRSRYGAQPLGLVLENMVYGLPGLAVGTVGGVTLSGLLVIIIGQVALTPENFRNLVAACLASFVSVIVTWSIALYANLSFGRIGR